MEGSKRSYPNRGFTVEFKDDNATASFEEVVPYNTLLTGAIFKLLAERDVLNGAEVLERVETLKAEATVTLHRTQ